MLIEMHFSFELTSIKFIEPGTFFWAQKRSTNVLYLVSMFNYLFLNFKNMSFFDLRLIPRFNWGLYLGLTSIWNFLIMMPMWIFISRKEKYSPRHRLGPKENGINAELFFLFSLFVINLLG